MKYKLIFFIVIIFLLRLAFSITTEFWVPDEDVLQIYLIGLKFFTTGQYPFYGADLVYTHAQIPGALQATLVSALWHVLRIPEAPFIFLNILMVLSSALLAWYIGKRLVNFPKYILWIWVFTTSWSICYFTKVINPSYVVPGAILFWIGIFEIYPALRKGIISEKLSFFLIGFSFFWIFQLHMSWVLLIPFIALAFFYLIKNEKLKEIFIKTGFFLLGCIISGSLVFPTLLIYGLSSKGGVGITSVVQLHFEHLKEVIDYLAKFLSYASYDTTRFFGGDSAQRLEFIKNFWWASPATILVTIFGIAQAILMIVIFFFKKKRPEKWFYVKMITLTAFILMSVSSVFSITTPGGHATVLMFPLVMIYAAYCFSGYLQKKWVISSVWIIFACSFIMYSAISINNYKNVSMYKNRGIIIKALEENNYQLVGKRRYDK